MVLPSLADVLLVIVLIVPGFVAYILFRKIGMREKKTSDLEATIWSLAASLIIYAVFAYVTGLYNIDMIRDGIFVPNNIVLIFGLAFAFGVFSGVFAKIFFRKGYRSGDCWEECMKTAARKGSYVLAYTSDGREYKGELFLAGASESPREVALKNPKLILRDSEGFVQNEFGIGAVLLLKEADIHRVVFLASFDA